MALADVALADLAQASTDVLLKGGVLARLTETARGGRSVQRPWAALGLGRILQALGRRRDQRSEPDDLLALRARALDVLREGLASKKNSSRERAAFAIAPGFAADNRSAKPLAALVGDTHMDPVLRTYAALGLGQLGQATQNVITPLRAIVAREPAGRLRREAAKALGLLHDHAHEPDVLTVLATRLPDTTDPNERAALLLDLGHAGNERALAPMLAVATDGAGPPDLRALAWAAVGIVGDLEDVPSLSLLLEDHDLRDESAIEHWARRIL